MSSIHKAAPDGFSLAADVAGPTNRIECRAITAPTGDIALRLATPGDVEKLRSISAEARARYRSTPALAFVASAPPLDAARFEGCRTMVAYATADEEMLGFASTRLLDGLLYLDNISVSSNLSLRGVGDMLLRDLSQHARMRTLPAITLTTFRLPRWNGPWFRQYGFQTMPDRRIGSGLRAVMDRQAISFDPATRETLWIESIYARQIA
jgi:hypothetical protein